ncbi:MAG: tRNA lysidine(34) synthetase TilS [SAR86 cluster bacterium]|nr:tRNA lysidine(34) synthetase TilS [SAR86 cluster bacterium]
MASLIEPLTLKELKTFTRIGVAFSGGLDSHVLLDLITKSVNKSSIYALHVNHKVSNSSDLWEKHCAEIADDLGVHFISWQIPSKLNEHLNEESLRDKRYAFLCDWAESRDVICTAHHQDDQSETILFRLIRGSGINGMKGIPKKTIYKNKSILRPLLGVTKENIKKYAIQNKLNWVEDDTNLDLRFDRNFIRKKILPIVEERWPSYQDSFKRFSERARDTQEILNDIADQDIQMTQEDKLAKLSISKLKKLNKSRMRNLLHRWVWLITQKYVESKIINKICENIILSGDNISSEVSIGKINQRNSIEVRKYDGYLHAIRYQNIQVSKHDTYLWDLLSPLKFPTGELTGIRQKGDGIKYDKKLKVEVKIRKGGEIIRPFGRNCSKSLKSLFQEKRTPPWERNRLPLIYLDGQLAAIANLWIDEKFYVEKGGQSILLNWKDNRII